VTDHDDETERDDEMTHPCFANTEVIEAVSGGPGDFARCPDHDWQEIVGIYPYTLPVQVKLACDCVYPVNIE